MTDCQHVAQMADVHQGDLIAFGAFVEGKDMAA